MTIFISGLQLKGSHGLYEEEKILQNDFLINVEVRYVPFETVIENLEDTINYVRIYEIVKNIFERSEKLLETLAMRMATVIKSEFAQVQFISIEIKKLHPPIEKFTGNVGVKYEFIY